MAFLSFPKGFLWGVATSAYQIEGSPLADGAGASIWHRFTHTPGTILNGDTGDTACDHYHRWRQDIALMRELGLKAYRFSTAWARIFPEGKGRLNPAGLDFYSRLVDTLLEAGIVPMLTLFHWDLPAALQDSGGWTNRDCAGWFADYAWQMVRSLGTRVPLWVTHNEPWVVTTLGYLLGQHAPGMRDLGAAARVAHHLLLGHALAVQAFRSENPPNAQIGIVNNLSPHHPASDSPMDQQVAEFHHQFVNRLFLDPLFEGRYPERVLATLSEFVPPIQEGDMELIQAPIDFVGVNYYTRFVVAYDPGSPLQFRHVRQPSLYTEMGWEVYPEGLYEILEWVRETYRNPTIYLTENGAAFPDRLEEGGVVRDQARLDYLRDHLIQAHRALQAGVALKGYFVWSLLDNFEWAHGFSKRFGLVYVDYATQQRILKQSARWYAQVIERNGLEP